MLAQLAGFENIFDSTVVAQSESHGTMACRLERRVTAKQHDGPSLEEGDPPVHFAEFDVADYMIDGGQASRTSPAWDISSKRLEAWQEGAFIVLAFDEAQDGVTVDGDAGCLDHAMVIFKCSGFYDAVGTAPGGFTV